MELIFFILVAIVFLFAFRGKKETNGVTANVEGESLDVQLKFQDLKDGGKGAIHYVVCSYGMVKLNVFTGVPYTGSTGLFIVQIDATINKKKETLTTRTINKTELLYLITLIEKI